MGQDRGEKIVVFKYKPKARTRVKKGFRAELTTLRIADISFAGRSAAKDAAQADGEVDPTNKQEQSASPLRQTQQSALSCSPSRANSGRGAASTIGCATGQHEAFGPGHT